MALKVSFVLSILYFELISFNYVAVNSPSINEQRRRLSVMSDNKLIEGMSGVNLEDEVC